MGVFYPNSLQLPRTLRNQTLWLAGVVASFVDNFNTGIMVRIGAEGFQPENKVNKDGIAPVSFAIHVKFQFSKTLHMFVLCIKLEFVHCGH